MDKKQYLKQYYIDNKEKLNKRNKEYLKEWNKSEKGYKSTRIYKWKSRGVISDDYDKLYEYFLSIKECENCGIELDNGTNTTKCLDHCHKTGQFRNILCDYCNKVRY